MPSWEQALESRGDGAVQSTTTRSAPALRGSCPTVRSRPNVRRPGVQPQPVRPPTPARRPPRPTRRPGFLVGVAVGLILVVGSALGWVLLAGPTTPSSTATAGPAVVTDGE